MTHISISTTALLVYRLTFRSRKLNYRRQAACSGLIVSPRSFRLVSGLGPYRGLMWFWGVLKDMWVSLIVKLSFVIRVFYCHPSFIFEPLHVFCWDNSLASLVLSRISGHDIFCLNWLFTSCIFWCQKVFRPSFQSVYWDVRLAASCASCREGCLFEWPAKLFTIAIQCCVPNSVTFLIHLHPVFISPLLTLHLTSTL